MISIRNHKHKLHEPIIYQETAKNDLIAAYFNQLKVKLPPNSFVILDNATYHNNKKIKEIVANSNITLIFLPPYSPELNPIEKLWDSVKKCLKSYYDNKLTLSENLNKAILRYTD